MDLHLWLVIGHLLGTVLAIGGATMIELHLTKALSDGSVSPEEGAMLQSDYLVVRIGFILSVLTGFGFLLLYKFDGQTAALYNPVLWAKITIVVIAGINALLLQARAISLYWGAALSFISWWSIGLLGIFLSNWVSFDLFGAGTFFSSYISVILAFVVSVAIGAFVLHIIRSYAHRT